MDKGNLTEKVDDKPILAVIKKKELLIILLLMVCLSILTAHNLKLYVMGLVTYLLSLRIIGSKILDNLLYIIIYNLSLTCILFGVASAIIINLI